MTGPEARRRFVASRIARLATADAGGIPHVVPIVFAVDADRVYSAVDGKPKRTWALRRLANITVNPNVAVLVDHYADDWSTLWWARADGTARVVGPDTSEGKYAIALLSKGSRDLRPTQDNVARVALAEASRVLYKAMRGE